MYKKSKCWSMKVYGANCKPKFAMLENMQCWTEYYEKGKKGSELGHEEESDVSFWVIFNCCC